MGVFVENAVLTLITLILLILRVEIGFVFLQLSVSSYQ